ncbi:MAG TPA: YlqD family protein [Spirochaetia bacterium]|nr:YlqD family protein [Spirochaetia bacterium]
MERITVTSPVAVLVRVTAGYRLALQEELKAALQGLEREEVRISHARRSAKDGDKETAARESRLLETRAGLVARFQEIEGLADGRLVLHGRLESLVEIRVGDRWQDVAGVEVVLEDGRVVEIRPAGGGGGDWWKST